jgi:hypothetical protein
MGKFLNGATKGLKIACHVALGSLAYGLGTGITNFHPVGTLGLIWNAVGVSLSAGAVAALFRWAQYDPSKVGK